MAAGGPVAELTLVVQAPAIRLAVGRHAAGVSSSGADRHEAEPTRYGESLRRRVAGRVSGSALCVGVLTPAVRRACRASTARLHSSSDDYREADDGRRRLTFRR